MAKKPHDAAAVRFHLKFANIHYKCRSSQAAPIARLQRSRQTRSVISLETCKA